MFKEWEELIPMGITGCKVNTTRTADTQAAAYNVNYLALQAIVWEDAPSLEAFLETYCKDYFGDAWKPVYEMYRRWEADCQKAAKDTQPGAAFFCTMLTEKGLVKSRSLLDEAMHATTDPKALYRVARLIILVEYARQAHPLTKYFYPLALAQRKKEPVKAWERKLLPMLKPMSDYARRMEELDQDLFGYPKEPALLGQPHYERLVNFWESFLGKLLKKEWALKAFNPNILETAVQKMKIKKPRSPKKAPR